MSPILDSLGSAKGFGWSSLVAAPVFDSIASYTGDTVSSSFSFSNIPQTYKHLQIRYLGQNIGASGGTIYARFNDISSTGYAFQYIRGNRSSLSHTGSLTSNSFIDELGRTYGNPNVYMYTGIIDIYDYSNSSIKKAVSSFNGWDVGTGGLVQMTSGISQSTAAITKITFTASAGSTFNSNSWWGLYGIKGA